MIEHRDRNGGSQAAGKKTAHSRHGALLHRDSPRLRVRLRIVNGDLGFQVSIVHSPEPLRPFRGIGQRAADDIEPPAVPEPARLASRPLRRCRTPAGPGRNSARPPRDPVCRRAFVARARPDSAVPWRFWELQPSGTAFISVLWLPARNRFALRRLRAKLEHLDSDPAWIRRVGH